MYVHWNSLIFWEGRPWMLVTIPIHELPKNVADALVQIENDLSMELTLPAFLARREIRPVWPNGDKSVTKLIDIVRGEA
jgi:hypothetical protein